MKITKIYFWPILLLLFLFLANFVLIQAVPEVSAQSNLWDTQIGNKDIEKVFGGDENPDPRLIAVRVIKAFLGFMGVIFVFLLVIGGYKYMTSGGNEEKTREAIGRIRTAIIGLIIILMAWAFTTFTTDCVFDITHGGMIWMCK
ncbi:MAG: MMCAP2_0565 family pilin-like conjugal transfer protein [Patescibacteria group bacterium]